MDPSMEKGMDRSTVWGSDPPAAFFVSGYMAGVLDAGPRACPYEASSVHGKMWINGYWKGCNMRMRIACENARRAA